MSYHATFIAMAEDCPAAEAVVPPEKSPPTKAGIEYAMLSEAPGEIDQDELNYAVYAAQCATKGVTPEERSAWLSVGRPCLRASPLTKRYGWGAYYDAAGKITLVPRGSDAYARHLADPDLKQISAMRSKRA